MTDSAKNLNPPVIPNHRRNLYFKIIDNYQDFNAITLRLYFLDDNFPPNKVDQALRWLVSNNLTGTKFVQWFEHECKKSDLEMHRLLLSICDNEAVGRIIAGRNFKL